MRRFPLHALRACTCAALLVGCQSAVAPVQPTMTTPPPPPPAQSLSFEIAGPSRIDAGGSFTWEAFAFGGSGAYQYRWDVRHQAGQQAATGSERRLSLHVVDTDGDIVLTLTVTSGGGMRVRSFGVRNCIRGCN